MANSINGLHIHRSPKMQFHLMTQTELTIVMAALAGNRPCHDTILFTHFVNYQLTKLV